MSEIVMEKIDKSGWGDGPWQTEPDKLNWEHAGLDCMIVRQPRMGHLCGYVGVPVGHPFHGKDYDACAKGCAECAAYDHSVGSQVEVHGGLTYADKCQGSICHVPKAGRPDDVWWLGFDCAHSGDKSPGGDATLPPRLRISQDVYRTVRYLTEETNRLAQQLSALSHPTKTGTEGAHGGR